MHVKRGAISKNPINTGIPRSLFWGVIVVSLAPSLLVFFEFAPLFKLSETKSGFLFFVFSSVCAGCIALISGALSFADFIAKRSFYTKAIGSLLSIAGLYHIFSFLSALNNAFSRAHFYSRWFFGQSAYLLLFLTIIGYLSFTQSGKLRNAKRKLFYQGLMVSCSVCLFVPHVLNIEPIGRIAHPSELIIAGLYLTQGFFIFPHVLRRFPTLLSQGIVLSVFPALLAHLSMAFHQRPFDGYFNSAYFLILIHYFVLLAVIILNHIESNAKEKTIINQLLEQVRERLDIEKNLAEREALLASAEKIARLGSWNYNVSTGKVTWSDEMYSILGLDLHGAIPSISTLSDVVLDEYKETVREAITSAIANKSRYSVELQIKRFDGAVRYLHGEGQFLPVEKKLVNILMDVTETKEASFKLSQSEALLKEAEALSHNGSWEWSQEKNAFFWSDEMYRIHGLIPYAEEVDLRFYLTLIHPDDVQHFVTTLADTQSSLAPFSIDYRIIRANGEVRYLTLNGKFKTDFYGCVNKVIGNTQDITELKNTSILLEKSESIYRTIARNVPDSAVFLFDNQLRLLLSSGPAIQSIEGSDHIQDAASFLDVVFKDEYSEIEKLIDAALGGKESKFERRIHNKTYKVSFTPVYLARGEVLGIMGVMHDISDIKEAQQNLEAKVLELNRSNNDLEQFAYIASHDLQEPLRKIRAFGERLNVKYRSFLPEEGLDYVQRMGNASERMQLLIDDLLTFSRISRPGEEVQPICLEEMVNQVIQDLEVAIDKKGATIDVKCAHKLRVVPSLLRQLLQNLLSNSLKFSKKDEALFISIHSEIVDGQVHPGLNREQKYCKIELKDNGIGFENQYAEKIFTLFHRLHSRNEYEGTGIGLAICKKIVENHNGIIEAEASENEGALFRIFLPSEIV